MIDRLGTTISWIGTTARPRLAATGPCTVVGNYGGSGEMGTRSITVERFQEIERRLRDGRVPDDVFLESSGKKDGIFAKLSCINPPL